MTDTQVFFAVLAAVYVFECVAAIRRDALLFVHPGTGRLRPRPVATLPGSRRRALALAPPFPPLGTFVAASPWPFSVSAEGATTWRVAAPNPGTRVEPSGVSVRFDAVRRFGASGRRVLVDGARFCDADTPREARVLAGLLERLRATEPSRRADAVRCELERSLDENDAAARLARFRSASLPLRVTASLLVLHLVGIAPAVALGRGLAGTWPWLLAGAVVLAAATVVFWARAHAAVRGERAGASELVALALTPPAAARGLDLLARDLFAGLHPEVVLRVACTAEVATRGIALAVRDARFPLPGDAPDEAAAEIAAAHHEAWRRALEVAVRRWGLDPEVLSGPPERGTGEVVAYCRRCGVGFTVAEGACADCGGLPRHRY